MRRSRGDQRDVRHGDCAASYERAPGRIAQRLANEGSAPSSDTLDRVLGRQPARLEQLVEFLREFVGDRGLELSEAIEVHIEGALRHRRLADHVVHSHGLDGAAAV